MTLSNELAPLSRTAAIRARLGPVAWRQPRALAGMFDRSTLPPDVIDEEVTEVICFKASLALNRLLGGAPDMTFSARAYHASTDADRTARRCGWRLVRAAVDLSCAMLRGEAHHCETAWVNHCRRPGRRN
ncbi:hypothetical protein [Marinovum sp.]|uniref:hypothetical protein n=1 Tax=Marinovum sp. TaxID=2024839 RepID=UPI002B269418|nr:hypothetical protein [Marinovum sp.]